MAFTIPDIALDASPVTDGLLPVYALDASTVTDGLLPVYLLNASLPVGLVLPKYSLTEAGPTTLTLTATGGILFGGGANIVGDPYVATGGILYSGTATIDDTKVSITQYFPLGGIRYSGTAVIDSDYVQFNPSGGIRYSGTATVVSRSLLNYTHVPSGGILYSGEAREPVLNFEPSGGIRYSGTADTQFVSIFAHTATGGFQYSGEADVYTALNFIPSGGIVYSGAATVVAKKPVFVPSGGIVYSGEALSIFLPSGAVLTPENPTGDVYSGLAMNYETAAVTRYEDIPVNSICTFNGETLVANAAGIHKLTKGDDAGQPIRASVTVLSNTDFGSKANKRVPYIYMGYKSDYNMRITVQTNTQNYTYKDLLTPNDGNRGTRAVLGRGLRGLYWTFRISNIDGAFFELDNFYVYPVTLDRMGV